MFVCWQCSQMWFLSCITCIHSSVAYISLQCSSQSDPTSDRQQVQLLLEEKQQLEAHNHQVCTRKDLSLTVICMCVILMCGYWPKGLLVGAQCFDTFSKSPNVHKVMFVFPLYVFDVVADGVDCPAAEREGLLCRADPGGGSCMEGQNRTAANTG